jgi:hypothetical protein
VDPTTWGVVGGIGVVFISLLAAVVKNLIVLCLPNEMVVITGRKRTVGGRCAFR